MTDKDIVFEPRKTYLWSVSMLDAKFTKPSGETQVEFMMQDTSGSGGSTDYGFIPVTVKYLGPGDVATDSHVKCLRVEAYTSQDFRGVPFGVGYVADDTDLRSIHKNSVNVNIAGLPTDKEYYIRAFIDTNGNGTREDWESWGYACYRGASDRNDYYTPRPFKPTNVEKGVGCEVYVEDADTNCNMVPDVLEYQTDGNGQKLLSPYIAYTASDEAKMAAIDYATNGDSGSKATLRSSSSAYAYATALGAMSAKSATPGLLAVATGGVTFEGIDSTHIKITSFSLDEGITLEVVVDEDFETAIGFGLDTGTIKVGVEYATTLENGGDWTSAGEPDSISFSLKAGTTEIGAESLSGIKAAIEGIKAKVSGAAYFRVRAIAVESGLK
jgi:hypothetical protein